MSMTITNKLKQRCEGICELCSDENAAFAYAVSPKNNDVIENEVALCGTCLKTIESGKTDIHWQCLAGSIWNVEPSVQALSYRILWENKEQEWANEIINSVELDENIIEWALSSHQKQEVHKDSNGDILANGDTVVLTQQLNVKGASFNAPKGTIVKKIRLVADNIEQIEGKINDQVIVILTKYVRRS